jgi:two-component system OmpR family sensor kinase
MGVLIAACRQSDFFSKHDLHFLEETARWVSMLFHLAELVHQRSEVRAPQAQRVAVEELLTILAHDLRNYLTPLKMRLELVERRARREDREQDMRDLAIALSSLSRFNRLISDLLDMTRLKQGIFSIIPRPLNLVDLVQETFPAFQTPQIQIHVQTQAQVVMVSADPDRLQQVLENLLSNAITHAPEQTAVSVTIQSEKQQNRNWAKVTVRNQEPGISSELRAQLFEPFVAGSTSKGLGLGLYLASRIAEAHQGHLFVDCPPEGGTAFILSIPMQT